MATIEQARNSADAGNPAAVLAWAIAHGAKPTAEIRRGVIAVER